MTDLSPAAKEVRAAFNKVSSWYHPAAVAAALRAAADAVTPAPPDSKPGTSPLLKAIRWERNTTREQLLAIAAELEGNA